jgi:hypothetical protein
MKITTTEFFKYLHKYANYLPGVEGFGKISAI